MKDHGGPVHPQVVRNLNTSEGDVWFSGISLRDHFAGQALAGCAALASHEGAYTEKTAAMLSYRLADAMLAEREETK